MIFRDGGRVIVVDGEVDTIEINTVVGRGVSAADGVTFKRYRL